METTPQLQVSEFQKVLTGQRMMVFRIIPAVLLLGVTLFIGIVLFLYATTSPKQPADDESLMRILSVVHGGLFFSFSIAGFVVYEVIVRPKGLGRPGSMPPGCNPDDWTPELQCSGRIFTGMLLRAACLEGVALFGAVVCLLGVLEGYMYQQPLYWLNLSSSVFFAAVTVWTFPTQERQEAIFKKRFMQSDLSILGASHD